MKDVILLNNPRCQDRIDGLQHFNVPCGVRLIEKTGCEGAFSASRSVCPHLSASSMHQAIWKETHSMSSLVTARRLGSKTHPN